MIKNCETCKHYYECTGFDEDGNIDYNDDYNYCKLGLEEYYLLDDDEEFNCDSYEGREND